MSVLCISARQSLIDLLSLEKDRQNVYQRSMQKHVGSVDDLVSMVGDGSRERLAEALGTTKFNVDKWVERGGVPARYYRRHTAFLQQQGYTHDPCLWSQVPLAQEGVSA
jgi:hypothetical protein